MENPVKYILFLVLWSSFLMIWSYFYLREKHLMLIQPWIGRIPSQAQNPTKTFFIFFLTTFFSADRSIDII